MSKKKCLKCKKNKSKDLFHKDKHQPDGLYHCCKKCRTLYLKLNPSPSKIMGTLSRFKTVSWSKLNNRTINGSNPYWHIQQTANSYLSKGTMLVISKQEFRDWCDKNEKLIMDIYRSGKKPSVDRIDSSKHYSLDNIQILELMENIKKGVANMVKNLSQPIIAYNQTETLFFSCKRDAQRKGFNRNFIKLCLEDCSRKYKNYFWKYGEK